MKRRLQWLVVLFTLAFSVINAQDTNSRYLYFADGAVWGFPNESVKDIVNDSRGCTVTLLNDSVLTWAVGEVTSVSDRAPEYPQFTEFKLDDKLNDQIFEDVYATVNPDRVTAQVGAIGKYLTPLFKMDRSDAVAYVNGEEQVSGQSRLRFADEVVYTLGAPTYRRLSMEKVSDEVWSEPETGLVEVALTEDMLSTNAPTSFADESLGMMLDGEPSTLFHSTWSQDSVYDVDLSKQVYVSVALPYSLSEFQFYYMGRVGTTQYNVKEWVIEASNDGQQWDYITSFDESSGIPYDIAGGTFTSPTIALGASYSHLRFTATRVGYKNYLCLAEFKIYEVVGTGSEPELLQPARYDYRMVPMGREVVVDIDWLTDHAASVPRIDIDIEGGEIVTSKDYYLNAHIRIQGNGVWGDFEDDVQIKGRGNSSWSTPSYYYEPKNPYRLKFASSVKPFGMKKGKNWNLIAQKLPGSLLTNPVAQKVARMVGMETANDVVPVELYMNGEYRGSYFFTQKVGMANNSVDYDDESQAALFELDDYWEDGQFRSDSYNLPVNIKDPEFGEDETLLDYDGTRAEFNRFETAVYNGKNFERFVDIDMLVRYMLVNDLILNTELGHPKSTFLARENLNRFDSKYTFGPAWDFDWSYGYEGTSSYCTTGATRDFFSYHSGKPGNLFFQDLLRSSEWVKYHYYQLWTDFIENHLQELIDYVDDYYAYASSSFAHNADMWGDGSTYSYNTHVANMKSWLQERARHIKNSLTPYSPTAAVPYSYGDINGDGAISKQDVESMLSQLLGSPQSGLQISQADVDVDGQVSVNDLVWVNQLVGDTERQQVRSRSRFEAWELDVEEEETGDFDIDDMPVLVGSQAGISNSPSVRSTDESVWIKTLTVADGLLDDMHYVSEDEYQYYYTSSLITSATPVECLRFMVLSTSSSDVDKSGYPCFALSEFYMYDANGWPIDLTGDNFSTNAQEYSEGPIKNIADDNIHTYFHSSWRAAIGEYHYIDITLPEAMSAFYIGYVSRGKKVAPAEINLYSVPKKESSEDEYETMVNGVVTLTVNEESAGQAVSVSLDNTIPYIAYMMDFILPDGFSVSEQGNSLMLTSRAASSHTMTGCLVDDNTYRVVGYSTSNMAIAEGEGELFSFSLSTSSDMPQGEYNLTVKDIMFVTEKAIQQQLADADCRFVYADKKQDQTISFDALPTKIYGDASLSLPLATDQGLPITYTSSDPSVATIHENVLTIVGAGSVEITATQDGNDEVKAATPVTRTLVVDKAILEIVANDVKRRVDAVESPELTMSFKGFVLDDTEEDLDELPQIACDVDASSPVGVYPIRLSGGRDDNYDYVLTDGTYTIVSKQMQTIVFDELPVKTYGDAPFTLPRNSDVGLVISYASDDTSVATIVDNVVTIVGAGSTEITATQEGNDEVYAATPVTRPLTVSKASLVIAADDVIREATSEDSLVFTLSFSGFVLDDTVDDLDALPVIECEADATSPVGTYPIRLSGGADNNYAYVLNDGVFTIIDTSDIGGVAVQHTFDVYDFHGRLVRKGVTSLEGLQKGVYLVNGKKIVKN